MPSLKDIRKRIASVKSTQKITRAMKLVSASKLRRAQENILNARPYAQKLHRLIGELASRTESEDHPLLADREPRRVLLLVMTSDRGLCGGFNTNILRTAEKYFAKNKTRYEELHISVVGRKGRDYLKHRDYSIRRYFPGFDVATSLECAKRVSNSVLDDFLSGSLDKVFLLYNEFKSAASQKVILEQLLPIVANKTDADNGTHIDYVYEPSKEQLLETIMPMYVHVETFRAALESTASEFGARMTAMENATNNASDMISSLTLEFNKARQASITKELLDIVGGTEALK